ncbi:hypothetical protein C8034_v003478 [Colletotrichum sidae]|uniref:Uncharacterized protein n=1 Tax=Colletotrichum sidae TaxID=1347389 RepID=A0A4R8TBZ8_9PEZI|nr:hypothetical protein C8034_v003478 [Colletotrichum sidae]
MSFDSPDLVTVDSLIRDEIVPAFRLETHSWNKCFFDSRGMWESNPYLSTFGLKNVVGKRMFVLNLPQDTKRTNFRLFNLTKRYYIALLLWSLDMERRNDPFLSPETFLNDQFQAWRNQDTSVDDSFEISHDLWLAMTFFQKERSVPQPAPKFLALP